MYIYPHVHTCQNNNYNKQTDKIKCVVKKENDDKEYGPFVACHNDFGWGSSSKVVGASTRTYEISCSCAKRAILCSCAKWAKLP